MFHWSLAKAIKKPRPGVVKPGRGCSGGRQRDKAEGDAVAVASCGSIIDPATALDLCFVVSIAVGPFHVSSVIINADFEDSGCWRRDARFVPSIPPHAAISEKENSGQVFRGTAVPRRVVAKRAVFPNVFEKWNLGKMALCARVRHFPRHEK